jgi:RNA polymerase sigma-70 factor (ECF subfamily)
MVVNMYLIDGYEHNEIAKILGISEGTSKSQLSRAKVHLRKKLIEMGVTV